MPISSLVRPALLLWLLQGHVPCVPPRWVGGGRAEPLWAEQLLGEKPKGAWNRKWLKMGREFPIFKHYEREGMRLFLYKGLPGT